MNPQTLCDHLFLQFNYRLAMFLWAPKACIILAVKSVQIKKYIFHNNGNFIKLYNLKFGFY